MLAFLLQLAAAADLQPGTYVLVRSGAPVAAAAPDGDWPAMVVADQGETLLVRPFERRCAIPRDTIDAVTVQEADLVPGGTAKPTCGRASDGQFFALGWMPKADIDAVVQRNMPKIRRCCQRLLRTGSRNEGTITIRFTIAPDGRVASATVKSSTLDSPALGTCIVTHFERFKFPAPSGNGGVIVSYPFIFSVK